jgi:hypothetical protein
MPLYLRTRSPSAKAQLSRERGRASRAERAKGAQSLLATMGYAFLGGRKSA